MSMPRGAMQQALELTTENVGCANNLRQPPVFLMEYVSRTNL